MAVTTTKSVRAFRADWRDPSQYPDISCENRLRLAWEFLRRNPLYAEHYALLKKLPAEEFSGGVKKKSQSQLDGLECWPPAQPSETAEAYHKRVTDKKKNKKGRIDKPCNTFTNRWGLKMLISPDQAYDEAIVKFASTAFKVKHHSALEAKSFNLFLYPNEIAFRFRLDLSLSQQIEIAQKRFEAEVLKFEGMLAQSDSKQTPTGQPLASLGKAREKKATTKSRGGAQSLVLQNAHYWLRSYDARTLPPELLGDSKKRTALKSGPAKVGELFKAEIAENKKYGMPQVFIRKHTVDDWKKAADSYINGLKFLTLLSPPLSG